MMASGIGTILHLRYEPVRTSYTQIAILRIQEQAGHGFVGPHLATKTIAECAAETGNKPIIP
jgi:hypothetical protein